MSEISSSQRPKVLFLCRHNSCRSQMCEAWTRAIHPTLFDPYSAGVDGDKPVDARAIAVMSELGIDMSTATSKLVSTFSTIPMDFVITVCDTDACPSFPGTGTRRLHHAFEDPPASTKNMENEEEKLAVYRRVALEIREFISNLPQTYSSVKSKTSTSEKTSMTE